MDNDNGRPARPWSRAERAYIIAGLLRMALIEIRFIADHPDLARHPDGHLAHIRALADVCHNLPGATEPRPAGEYDALVWTWQTANEFQQKWLQKQFDRLGVDPAFLIQAPRLPRPATAPDTGPGWGRWQLPQNPGAFKAVSTATLSTLVRDAREREHPTSKTPAREAFIGWVLDHLHPDGMHILRPSRADENRFVPDGPGDLRQYRALLTMCDGALIVDHPRLPASAVDALPANLSWLRRNLLASVPRRGHERDAGLWARDHRAANPECRHWMPDHS